MKNQFKTAALLGLLTCLIIWIGGMIGGSAGVMIAFIFALAINVFSYWYSDSIVLKMHGARQVPQHEAPELYDIVAAVSGAAGLPMPKIYRIPSDSPNAFATGRNPNHAAVAVTDGLVRLLDREELSGVISHEMAHIHNRDILIQTVAAVLAGTVTAVAGMARWAALFGGFGSDEDDGGGIAELLVVAIVAPIAAVIIQLAISRSREYLADSTGAGFAGTSAGLSRALEKLESASKNTPLDANPSSAHLFIVAPFSGKALMQLFSTHPPVAERVKRLRALSR